MMKYRIREMPNLKNVRWEGRAWDHLGKGMLEGKSMQQAI